MFKKKLIILFVFAGIFCLLISGCSSKDSSTEIAEQESMTLREWSFDFLFGSQVFLNEGTGSELLIPGEWSIESNEYGLSGTSFDGNLIVVMERQAVPPEAHSDLRDTYTLDEYGDMERGFFLNSFRAGFIRSSNGIIEGGSGFLTLDSGHQAAYLIAHSPSPNEPSIYFVTIIYEKDMVMALGMGKTRDEFEKNKGKLEKILKTLKIEEK